MNEFVVAVISYDGNDKKEMLVRRGARLGDLLRWVELVADEVEDDFTSVDVRFDVSPEHIWLQAAARVGEYVDLQFIRHGSTLADFEKVYLSFNEEMQLFKGLGMVFSPEDVLTVGDNHIIVALDDVAWRIARM